MPNRQNAFKNDIATSNFEDKGGLIGKAYQYYLKGLTAKETAILLNVSERTVQRWTSTYEFAATAKPKTMQQRVVDLQKLGLSYAEISKALKVSRSTVYNYLKAARVPGSKV
ncbi:helix-turn-helix domain-containing protein [Paraflavitalea speifideaquila]|uniref:helix-turn-helix domain-containing protein n=1 Tax=Paraflavitalea speifideaquila TaxID=3076558 RepID=UPI0028E5EB15|nr:helix-turn-helix domain-containing protein [Paraflavitalea speifideiaquila]